MLDACPPAVRVHLEFRAECPACLLATRMHRSLPKPEDRCVQAIGFGGMLLCIVDQFLEAGLSPRHAVDLALAVQLWRFHELAFERFRRELMGALAGEMSTGAEAK